MRYDSNQNSKFIKIKKHNKMKTNIFKTIMIAAALAGSNICIAQNAELRLEIKDIKEQKGNIMIAVKNSEAPEQVVYEMVKVGDEKSVVCTLKNIPVGKVDISVFQDLNENHKLDMDEQKIPLEPCCSKEKVKIQEGENRLAIKLIDVRKMMGL